MGRIRETMKVACLTLVKNPKLFVPYGIYGILMTLSSNILIIPLLRMHGVHKITFLILSMILLISLYLFLTPFIEAWTYSLLNIYFTENDVSFRRGLSDIRSKYFGFFGFTIISCILISIFMIPIFILYFLAIMNVIMSENYSTAGIYMTMEIFMTMIIFILIFIQTLLAYMKPAYTYRKSFILSIREDFSIIKRYFWKTAIILTMVLILGILISIPYDIEIILRLRNIIEYGISPENYPPYYSFWQLVSISLRYCITGSLTATAFTHLYLTFAKDSSPQITEHQPL